MPCDSGSTKSSPHDMETAREVQHSQRWTRLRLEASLLYHTGPTIHEFELRVGCPRTCFID